MKHKLKKLRDQVIVITGASSGIGLVTARMAAKRGARLVLAARSEESLGLIVDEIQQHGCVCKGVEQGLLDFPCLLGEEIVFLCWQYGEPEIAHWHKIEDGFAGRRPLLDSTIAGSSGGGALH